MMSRPLNPSLSAALPVPDIVDLLKTCSPAPPGMNPTSAVPESAWFDGERARYLDLLARAPARLLVLPVQTQFNGFDLTERTLMSAEIAAAVNSNAYAPDPMLVALALGEPLRRYEDTAVTSLAQRVGATRVIRSYAGHNLDNRLTLTVQELNCSATAGCKVVRQKDWRALPFTSVSPPFKAVRAIAGEISREFAGSAARPAVSAARSDSPWKVNFDWQQLALGKVTTDPASLAGFLASLAPDDGSFVRQRLHIQALRAAMLEPSTPRKKLLAANAAMQLHRRPFALQLLEGMHDPGAEALRNIINGNIVEAESQLAAVTDPLQRYLVALGIQDLRIAYGRKGDFDAANAAGLVDPSVARSWAPFVYNRCNACWAEGNEVAVKRALDAAFPNQSFAIGTITQDASGIKGANDIAVVSRRHLNESIAKLDARSCCGDRTSTSWSVYWLLEASADADVDFSLRHTIERQGLADQALRRIDQLDDYYAGNPQFEYRRLAALTAVSTHAANDVQKRYETRIREARRALQYWAQGQTRVSALVDESPTTENWETHEGYTRDYPTRSFYPLYHVIRRAENPKELQFREACGAMEYASSDTRALRDCLLMADPSARTKLEADFTTRFHGNPNVVGLLKPAAAKDEGFVAQQRRLIKENPDEWGYYEALGDFFVADSGNYQEAARTYLSYPGFKTRGSEDPVGLSNAAYSSATTLFWQGMPELSRPLYQIAADLDTGSSASMGSAIRLSMLDGDFETAAEDSLARASRYPNAYTYRDALVLQYLLGDRAGAWQGFAQIGGRFELPEVWYLPLVAQRQEARSDAEQRAWMLRDDVRDVRYRGRRMAPIYALWWSTTDRVPTAATVELLRQIERNASRVIDSNGVSTLVPSTKSEQGSTGERPSALVGENLKKLPPGTAVKSEYVMIAEGMSAAARGDHAAAVAAYMALADRYSIEWGELNAVIPYFAWSAAKTGDKVHLESFIEPKVKWGSFDETLAQAVFDAVRHDAAGAEKELKRAFRKRPYTDARPVLSEWQYAWACELALKETGDDRFRVILLDWAKKYQVIQPTYAWAYALEASYTRVPADRTRAIAMTLLLDSGSERLRRFGAPQIAAARAWLKANDPFKRHPAPPPQPTTSS